MSEKLSTVTMREGAAASPNTPAIVLYKNYRNEIALRRVSPASLWKGQNDFHRGDQWLLSAMDTDRNVMRTYAMADVLAWSRSEDSSLVGIRENPLIKVVLTLASQNPYEGEHQTCTLCRADLPSFEQRPEHHEPECAWRMAKELAAVIERYFR